jgi:hypothetical protein
MDKGTGPMLITQNNGMLVDNNAPGKEILTILLTKPYADAARDVFTGQSVGVIGKMFSTSPPA